MKAEVHPFTPNCGFTPLEKAPDKVEGMLCWVRGCLKLSLTGFTLLEIVVTLTVASVLGTIIFLYMNTSLTRSTEPVARIQTTYSLNQIVEQITADYKTLKDSNGDYNLTTLQGNIQNGNVVGNTPYYGEYTQVTGYIKFNVGRNEEPDSTGENRILKVAITSNNQTTTVLFTK